MNKINTTSALLLLTALYLNAQITDTINNHIGSSPSILPSYDETTNPDNEKSTEFEKEHLTTSSEQSTDRSFESQADISSISKQNICNADATADTKSPKLSDVQWGATVDMQVDKEMWDEFGMDSKNRLQHSSLTHAYRRIVDDFWMRVALRAKYQYRFIESAFALRFYPYWTLRRKGGFEKGADLDMFMDVLEINQAYIKFYKEYNSNSNKFAAHLKIGRDGLLSTGSQLFGNYLELPTAGYGDSRSANVTGPFKNRKVFANQLEIGFNFKISDVLSGTTSLMRGGNVNNRQWYTAPSPAISEEMDSRLSAGFTRGYQDLYFWNERIHFGAGFRIYTTKVSKTAQLYFTNESNELDSTVTSFATNSKYINGDWTFDFTILPGLKLYSEFGYQKLGAISETGIVRPFTAGITIPTGGVLDLLAFEIENVSNTFFSNLSRRDPVGNRKDTKSFAWGIVIDKWFLEDRAGVSWGVYTGNPYGDMKTSLRLTSNF